jgi:uncharacterized protein
MTKDVVRVFWVCAGFLSLLLGLIGIFLPVMPTTPFVILAAFCFSRGSKRLHEWILSQKHLGPMIRDWEEHGVVPLRAKVLTTILLAISTTSLHIFAPVSLGVKLAATLTIVLALAYVLSRPSTRRNPPRKIEP